jgi:hypothetical protein
MMETIRSSETSILTGATWRNTPESGILHSHRRENLKSYRALHIYSNKSSNFWDPMPYNPSYLRGQDSSEPSMWELQALITNLMKIGSQSVFLKKIFTPSDNYKLQRLPLLWKRLKIHCHTFHSLSYLQSERTPHYLCNTSTTIEPKCRGFETRGGEWFLSIYLILQRH